MARKTFIFCLALFIPLFANGQVTVTGGAFSGATLPVGGGCPSTSDTIFFATDFEANDGTGGSADDGDCSGVCLNTNAGDSTVASGSPNCNYTTTVLAGDESMHFSSAGLDWQSAFSSQTGTIYCDMLIRTLDEGFSQVNFLSMLNGTGVSGVSVWMDKFDSYRITAYTDDSVACAGSTRAVNTTYAVRVVYDIDNDDVDALYVDTTRANIGTTSEGCSADGGNTPTVNGIRVTTSDTGGIIDDLACCSSAPSAGSWCGE